MEQDQTTGAVRSGSTLFVKKLLTHFSRRRKQTTFVLIGALRFDSYSDFDYDNFK